MRSIMQLDNTVVKLSFVLEKCPFHLVLSAFNTVVTLSVSWLVPWQKKAAHWT